MTYDRREPKDTDFELLEARLHHLFQSQASSSSDKTAATSIWDSMQSELRRDIGNDRAAKVTARGTTESYLSYGSALTFTAVGLLLSVGSIFLVAAKQRSDGTVLSTVNHLEQVMRRDRTRDEAQPELLPEEQQIWRELLQQNTDQTELVSSLAIGQALQH